MAALTTYVQDVAAARWVSTANVQVHEVLAVSHVRLRFSIVHWGTLAIIDLSAGVGAATTLEAAKRAAMKVLVNCMVAALVFWYEIVVKE